MDSGGIPYPQVQIETALWKQQLCAVFINIPEVQFFRPGGSISSSSGALAQLWIFHYRGRSQEPLLSLPLRVEARNRKKSLKARQNHYKIAHVNSSQRSILMSPEVIRGQFVPMCRRIFRNMPSNFGTMMARREPKYATDALNHTLNPYHCCFDVALFFTSNKCKHRGKWVNFVS